MIEHASLMGLDEASSDEAYARVLPEAVHLPSAQVRSVNLDLDKVITLAMSAARRLHPFEAQLRVLQGFPVEQFDRLADYILALYRANLLYGFATRPPEKLPVLNGAAQELRIILLAEARSLATRKLIQVEQLNSLVGYRGFRNVAADLGGLAQIFKANWERIKNDTGLKLARIEEADQLALRLTGAVATRKRSPAEIETSKDIRARMFTLLSRAYDEVRRAIQYIRGPRNDADEIVPSLYSGRSRSRVTRTLKREPIEPNPNRVTELGIETVADAAVGASAPCMLPASRSPRVLVDRLSTAALKESSTPALLERSQANHSERDDDCLPMSGAGLTITRSCSSADQTSSQASTSGSTSGESSTVLSRYERRLPKRKRRSRRLATLTGFRA
ncbi:MAG: hypothetical protein QM784_07015 [Polyangiaceae bacterium]